ncbi:MAG: LPS export ABC transporter ATP-binding protein [Planctomycetes bacterium]|nr:LPS export ABC transporter ATP-binding protein [Planctomycetota bacterium]
MPLLNAKSLIKTYGRRTVVDQVSFHLDGGEIVGLLGPNGAGKTTTFRMTVGMITPDEGSVYLKQKDITRLPMYRRARMGMGYLSQEPSIFRQMTVIENIQAILEANGFAGRRLKDRSMELLTELSLTHLAKNRADTLSGGERRRLEITRTLVTQPKIILLDEPFSGVDPIAVEDIQNILFTLRDRGIGILITDHAVRETLATCDRSYIISEGRILKQGDANTLAADPEVRRVYLGERFELTSSSRIPPVKKIKEKGYAKGAPNDKPNK